jgi:hypothetical protein
MLAFWVKLQLSDARHQRLLYPHIPESRRRADHAASTNRISIAVALALCSTYRWLTNCTYPRQQ